MGQANCVLDFKTFQDDRAIGTGMGCYGVVSNIDWTDATVTILLDTKTIL